jgi:hypothetical protein
MGDNSYCLSHIYRKKAPSEWRDIINYCKKEYGYVFVGIDKPITTTNGGKFMCLYFQAPDGVYHCLPTTQHTRRTTNRHPLFAW